MRGIGSLRALIPAVLIVLLAFGAVEAQARSRIPPELADRAAREGAVRIIVQLDVPTLPEGRLRGRRSRLLQRQRIAAAQDGLSAELAGTTHRTARRFRSIPFAALEVGPQALSRLERSARVVAVQEDRLHRPLLDVSAPLVEADQAASMGYDGSGQTVVVLDTGADANHPNLAGKIVAEACFAAGNDCPNGERFDDGQGSGSYCTYSEDCFHGTHVAGIAVGAGASYPGVAPGASLIPIQVFSKFTGSACDPDPESLCSVMDLRPDRRARVRVRHAASPSQHRIGEHEPGRERLHQPSALRRAQRRHQGRHRQPALRGDRHGHRSGKRWLRERNRRTGVHLLRDQRERHRRRRRDCGLLQRGRLPLPLGPRCRDPRSALREHRLHQTRAALRWPHPTWRGPGRRSDRPLPRPPSTRS